MKKSILNIGKALEKSEQKKINGGFMLAGCSDLGYPYSCRMDENYNPSFHFGGFKMWLECCYDQ